MSKTIRPSRPTRRQKEIIDALRLVVDDYLVCTETENMITLYNKHTKQTKTWFKKGRISDIRKEKLNEKA